MKEKRCIVCGFRLSGHPCLGNDYWNNKKKIGIHEGCLGLIIEGDRGKGMSIYHIRKSIESCNDR